MKPIATALLIAMSVLSTACSSSNLGQRLNIGIATTAVADLTSTHGAIQRGAIEANPLMGTHPTQQATVKAAGTAGMLALLQKLDVKHPMLANVMRASVVVGWTFVSVHNAGVAR
jgi:hypothetical protein